MTYTLLKKYLNTAKVKSVSYSYSEAYYRTMYKWLTYPLIILASVNTVLASFDITHYALMSISITTLILTGFNTAINPKDKENLANHIKIEFGEIASNITQFIYENHKSKEQVKAFTHTIHELMNVWESQSPPIKNEFIKRATIECSIRTRNQIRNSDSSEKKKIMDTPLSHIVVNT